MFSSFLSFQFYAASVNMLPSMGAGIAMAFSAASIPFLVEGDTGVKEKKVVMTKEEISWFGRGKL